MFEKLFYSLPTIDENDAIWIAIAQTCINTIELPEKNILKLRYNFGG